MEELIGLTPRDAGRLSRLLTAAEAGAYGPRRPRSRDEPERLYEVWPWHNNSAETCPAFGVVRIDEGTLDGGDPILQGFKPNSTFRRIYLVNGPDDVPAGGDGWGTWIWDADWVLYDTGAIPSPGEEWGAKNNEWRLFQHRPGFLVSGPTAGSGSESRVKAVQYLVTHVRVRTDTAIASGASGTCRVYGGLTGTDDLGQTIAGCQNPGGTSLADEADTVVLWLHGIPHLTSGGSALPGVPFVNRSGQTMPPCAVIRAIGGEEIGGIPHIRGFKPNNNFDNFWLINGQTAVANGATGLGSFLTDLVGFVAIGSSATPGQVFNWGPQPNSWELGESRLGFFPLREAAFTINGQRCGYFKQRFIDQVIGKWYTTLAQGGSAEFQIYYLNENKQAVPAGWDRITAYDFWLQMNQQVAAGTKGKVIWYTNSWVMDLTACEVSNVNESGSSAFLAAFAANQSVYQPQPQPAATPYPYTLLQPVLTP